MDFSEDFDESLDVLFWCVFKSELVIDAFRPTVANLAIDAVCLAEMPRRCPLSLLGAVPGLDGVIAGWVTTFPTGCPIVPKPPIGWGGHAAMNRIIRSIRFHVR